MIDTIDTDGKSIRIFTFSAYNVSTPELKAKGYECFIAKIPIRELWKLDPTRTRTRRCAVHHAIRNTLETNPECLDIRSNGITVNCSSVTLNDDKSINVSNIKISDGRKTLDEIELYINEHYIGLHNDGFDKGLTTEMNVHLSVRFLINVKENADSPKYTSKSAWLVDLRKAIELSENVPPLRSSALDHRKVLEPEHLIQLCRLVMPMRLQLNSSNNELYTHTFVERSQCLQDFIQWQSLKDSDIQARKKYLFTLAIAPQALEIYRFWLNLKDWTSDEFAEQIMDNGSIIHTDAAGNVRWINPGLINPIVHAMSVFVNRSDNLWNIDIPEAFNARQMIRVALGKLQLHNNDPIEMGRRSLAYEALKRYSKSTLLVENA